MGIVQHEINGRAIYDAIKINGAEHIRGDWVTLDSNGKPTAGCALGLAAINLKIRANSSVNRGANLYEQLMSVQVDPSSRWYVPHSNSDSGITNVADTIIYWNDGTKYERDERGYQQSVYLLPTWEEVHQMAHDVLEPHFATIFKVDVWEWDINDTDFGGFSLPESSYEPDDDDYDDGNYAGI